MLRAANAKVEYNAGAAPAAAGQYAVFLGNSSRNVTQVGTFEVASGSSAQGGQK